MSPIVAASQRASVLLICNSAWGLFNFRAGLIRSLLSQGHRVVILAPVDAAVALLQELGCTCHPLQLDSRGLNPLRDLDAFVRIYLAYRRMRPTVVIQYTIKPVIYGSVAGRVLGIPIVNVITGLGTAFEQEGWLTRIASTLYRASQRKVRRIYFLNDDDRELFARRQLAPPEVMETLPGEGIDARHFSFSPLPAAPPVSFLMVARLLVAKGVREYVEAARVLLRGGIQATFRLLGPFDTEPSRGILRAEVDAWVSEGVIDYRGEARDVRHEMLKAHCVVLPSFYREGLPRVLLEAAAMGRPIITTDNVGCRDVVRHGENGFLCAVRDVQSLAFMMRAFIELDDDARSVMGRAGRTLVESHFEERHVIKQYMKTLQGILGEPSQALLPEHVPRTTFRGNGDSPPS